MCVFLTNNMIHTIWILKEINYNSKMCYPSLKSSLNHIIFHSLGCLIPKTNANMHPHQQTEQKQILQIYNFI